MSEKLNASDLENRIEDLFHTDNAPVVHCEQDVYDFVWDELIDEAKYSDYLVTAIANYCENHNIPEYECDGQDDEPSYQDDDWDAYVLANAYGPDL